MQIGLDFKQYDAIQNAERATIESGIVATAPMRTSSERCRINTQLIGHQTLLINSFREVTKEVMLRANDFGTLSCILKGGGAGQRKELHEVRRRKVYEDLLPTKLQILQGSSH